MVSGISQRLTCEGSHLLSFLPLGVGNLIKSPHSWQGERRHARSGSAWFENSRQKPPRRQKTKGSNLHGICTQLTAARQTHTTSNQMAVTSLTNASNAAAPIAEVPVASKENASPPADEISEPAPTERHRHR